MILSLHGHALYSEIELRELYSVYRDKGAAGQTFEQFVELRFVKHPYFSDAKYLWRADYERAVSQLKQAQEKPELVTVHADKKRQQAG